MHVCAVTRIRVILGNGSRGATAGGIFNFQCCTRQCETGMLPKVTNSHVCHSRWALPPDAAAQIHTARKPGGPTRVAIFALLGSEGRT